MDDLDSRAIRIARAALDADPVQRDSFIVDQCGADAGLRQAVETLLRKVSVIESSEPGPDAQAVDPLLGSNLGPFRVVEQIGRGGMGVVYRAEREGADFAQTVAIKLIRRGFDFDDVQARFLRERRILARLNHTNLARFIDGGVADDGRPWFALEYVRGESIRSWCDRQHLDVRGRVTLFLDVCAAVQHAHTQLIVHRDLKPGNVLVDQDGVVRLLDFGISRLLDGDEQTEATLTVAGQRLALTPEYAAPEQLAGEPADVAADVYALGAILYELIAGVLPHEVDRHDLSAARQQIQSQPLEPLAQAISRTRSSNESADRADTVNGERRLAARSLSARAYRSVVRGDLNRIIGKALAAEPIQRYPTVDALADDLRRWLDGVPVKVSGRRWTYRFAKFVRRNAAAVTTAAVLMTGLLAALGWALERAYSERQQREAAQSELRRSNAVRDYIALMFRSAGEQDAAGQVSARDVLEQGAERIFSQFQGDPETGLTTALMIAELYFIMGDLDGAKPLFERLLAMPGIETNVEVQAMALYDLAQIELRQGNLEAATRSFERVEALWHQQPEKNAVLINESSIVKARIMRDNGKTQAAAELLGAAIVQRKRLLGSPDEALAALHSTLADILIKLTQPQEALVEAESAVAVLVSLGVHHSRDLLAARNTQVVALSHLRRLDEAELVYRELIELHRRFYGPSSLDLAILIGNLGVCISMQQDESRTEEAAFLLKDAIVMAGRHVEPDHLAVRSFRLGMVQLMNRQGRHLEALGQLEQIESLLDLTLDNSLMQGTIHAGRAQAYLALGELARAREELTQAEALHARQGAAASTLLAKLAPLHESLQAAETAQR